MGFEEVPHLPGRVEVLRGVAVFRRYAAPGPGVAAALHGAKRDGGVLAAVGVRAAGAVALVVRTDGVAGADVAAGPARHRVLRGRVGAAEGDVVAAMVVDGPVIRAVEVHHRDGAHGRAGREALHAGHGRDGRDL